MLRYSAVEVNNKNAQWRQLALRLTHHLVMAGLVPAIHVFGIGRR